MPNLGTRHTILINGHQVSSIVLNDISSNNELAETEKIEEEWAQPIRWFTFRPNSPRSGTYFVEAEARCGTEIYFLDPARKTIQFLTNADTESWSPDYKSFCTCALREESSHPLLTVLDTRTLKVRTIQGGLIDCSGADWKDGHRVGLGLW